MDENAEEEKDKKEKNKEPEWMINSTVTNDDPYRNEWHLQNFEIFVNFFFTRKSNNRQMDLGFSNQTNDDIDDILKLETKNPTKKPAVPVPPPEDSDNDDFVSGDEDEGLCSRFYRIFLFFLESFVLEHQN